MQTGILGNITLEKNEISVYSVGFGGLSNPTGLFSVASNSYLIGLCQEEMYRESTRTSCRAITLLNN